MTSFTSESDSNLFAGEKIQRHFVFFFFSLTTDMNHNSQNPRVPVSRGVWHGAFASGVRVRYFLILAVSPIVPFRLQLMDTLKEGHPWQMWKLIPILYVNPRLVRFQASFKFCDSVTLRL